MDQWRAANKLRVVIDSGSRLKVGVIGAGLVGKAVVRGLLASDEILPGDVFVSTRRPDIVKDLDLNLNHCFDDNFKLVTECSLVVMCCQPTQLPEVAKSFQNSPTENIKPHPKTVLLSVASAVGVKKLRQLFGTKLVLRTQPITHQVDVHQDPRPSQETV
eukprot:707248_1